MKAIPILLVVLGLIVAAAAQSNQEAKQKPCQGCGDEENDSRKKHGGSYPDAPCFCPMVPVDYWGDDSILYYCNHYAQSGCGDYPTAAYIVGIYEWPSDPCSADCVADDKGRRESQKTGREYLGINEKVKSDFWPQLQKPECNGVELSRTHGLEYIKEKGSSPAVYAMVFTFGVRMQWATGSGDPSLRKNIYVAFETSEVPTNYTELEWLPAPTQNTVPSQKVFQATKGSGMNRVPILILKAKSGG